MALSLRAVAGSISMVNTKGQESFISTLNTKGALNKGSGFDRAFGAGESNDAYKARLAAFQGGGAPGGGGGIGGGSAMPGSMAGLNTVVTPPPSQGTSSDSLNALMGSGGGGDVGGGLLGDTNGLLRSLGRRMVPADPLTLQRKAY